MPGPWFQAPEPEATVVGRMVTGLAVNSLRDSEKTTLHDQEETNASSIRMRPEVKGMQRKVAGRRRL